MSCTLACHSAAGDDILAWRCAPPETTWSIHKATWDITKSTRVSEILEEYGDIADVMEALRMMRVGGLSFRRVITRAITVKRAAQMHREPVDDLMEKVYMAVADVEAGDLDADA
jgi:hypothetical protein